MLTQKSLNSLLQSVRTDLLKNNIEPAKIILFGSYATGGVHKYSDVDVAVWSDKFIGDLVNDFEKIQPMVKKHRNVSFRLYPRHASAVNFDPFIKIIEETGICIYEQKNKPDARGFVYSTNPDFLLGEHTSNAITLPANQQKLKMRIDTKHRAGKAVTLLEGFVGAEADLNDLGKKLKTICGTGGSVKDGQIIIQGDQREKIMQWLQKNGYTLSKII